MAVTEKQKANLRPPVPGEIRNPNGKRPGTKNRATYIKQFANIKLPKQSNPLKPGTQRVFTVEEAIDVKLIEKALKGDLKAITLFKELLYGKIPVDVNLWQEGGNPVNTDRKINQLTKEELLQVKYGANWKEISGYT
jgi:hypothetical protein